MEKNTKNMILGSALELFSQKGYDKATIEDIVTNIGISKGAFYHYFKSKEDVVEAIADQYVDNIMGIIDEMLRIEGLNPLEKLNKWIEVVQIKKKTRENERAVVKKVLKREENLFLENKITNKIKEKFTPRLKVLIDQGVEEGYFDVSNTQEFSEFFMYNSIRVNTSIDEILEKNEEGSKGLIYEKLKYYELIFERVLKLKKGKLVIAESFMKKLFDE